MDQKTQKETAADIAKDLLIASLGGKPIANSAAFQEYCERYGKLFEAVSKALSQKG